MDSTARPDVWIIVTSVAAAIAFYVGIWYTLCDSIDRRKQAYLLALVNSIITACLSSVCLLTWVEFIVESGWEGGVKHLFSSNVVSHLILDSLIGYCIADSIIGSCYYFESMKNLDGWAHHIPYAVILLAARYLNFYSNGIAVFCSAEVPTALFNIGYIWPEYRSDLGYGVLMFIFRILGPCLNAVILFTSGKQYATSFGSFVLLTLVVQSYWLYKWTKVYSSIKKKRIENTTEREAPIIGDAVESEE